MRTQRDENRVIIETSDTGTGMNEETRARCLEPFFSTKADQGTGLGLSMVFGIIQRHDGKLEIESKQGCGTTFRISFPSQVELFQSATGEVFRPEQLLRILVVDDESVPGDVVTKYLQADGHEVVNAISGADALARFQAEPFDLLVTDQGMPGMSGVQLAGAIKQIKAGQPVILLTGFSDPALAHDEAPAGVDLVLGKPIPQKELRLAVAQLLPA